jgi:lipopolysaccharide/colanic/teichoic acid biosynthesis glycosyltransferase
MHQANIDRRGAAPAAVALPASHAGAGPVLSRSVPDLLPIPLDKLLFDKAFALLALIFAAPVMAAIALAVWLEGGPVFFGHERVGQGGRRFRCLKFRTMLPGAQRRFDEILAIDPIARDEWHERRKLERDPRVSRLGAFLRSSSLDELPQFWNILVGDMSVVGPRPVTADEAAKYGENFALYKSGRPGLTGAWQVSGRSDASYAERVALDVAYVHGRSMRLDLQIVWRTVGAVLSKRGAC